MVDETRTNGEIKAADDSSSSSSKSPAESTKTCVSCAPNSPLEDEAMQAVKEAAPAVNTIAISEMLPRTSDLLFINVTTLEGQTYCIELCIKGYRIASARQDCMNGDFRQLGLHTRYFESIYELMNSISLGYREKFASSLTQKLLQLASEQGQ